MKLPTLLPKIVAAACAFAAMWAAGPPPAKPRRHANKNHRGRQAGRITACADATRRTVGAPKKRKPDDPPGQGKTGHRAGMGTGSRRPAHAARLPEPQAADAEAHGKQAAGGQNLRLI